MNAKQQLKDKAKELGATSKTEHEAGQKYLVIVAKPGFQFTAYGVVFHTFRIPFEGNEPADKEWVECLRNMETMQETK